MNTGSDTPITDANVFDWTEVCRGDAPAKPALVVDADIVRALERDAEIGRLWRENSSLEKWFPFTAETLARLTEEKEALTKEQADAKIDAVLAERAQHEV